MEDQILTERLRAAFEGAREARDWSYRDAQRAIDRLMGDDSPTIQTIGQYHKGLLPKSKPSTALLIAMARIYDLRLEEIAPEFAPRVERFVALVGGRADPPDEGTHSSLWNIEPLDHAA